MTIPETTVGETTQSDLPQHPRFRFGLKMLFVMMTLFCVGLGYKMVREPRTTAIIARHREVLNAIVANATNPPAQTNYRINPGSADELTRNFEWPGEAFQRDSILRTGHTGTATSQQLLIDISPLLPNTNRDEIGRGLLSHYSRGLQELGLRQTFSIMGGHTGTSRTETAWSSPTNEISLIIDAEVSADNPIAEVRILVLDNQQLSFW